jgi:SAM-dependent methyltransferase
VDPYQRIAAFYDCEHADFGDDIQFYLNSLPPGPVLEAGAGTGRVAGPLAGAGFQVHGIDPSPAMLQRARQRYGRLRNVSFGSGSLLDLPHDRRFASAVLTLNTLWHLTDQREQVAALVGLRRVLEPDGLLLTDLTNPLAMADRGAGGQVRERFRGPCSDSLLIIQSAAWDDQAAQLLHLELIYDCVSPTGSVARTPATLVLRYLYLAEFALMLQLAGFQMRDVFGSYDLLPFEVDSDNILVVAAPA